MSTTEHPDTTSPRWQRRPEARPEEIIDAAEAVFSECGFDRAKLEEVARRAGVSKGTLYLYFDSKESLFRAMIRARIEPFLAEGEEIVRAHSGSCRDLLILYMRRIWDAARQPARARIARLVSSELDNFPELAEWYYNEFIQRAKRVVRAIIDRGIASGEFRPGAGDFAPQAICSILVHGAQLQRFFSRFDPAARTDEQIASGASDFILHAVLAHPEPDLPS
jgi:AcrR family transcriptional regulator